MLAMFGWYVVLEEFGWFGGIPEEFVRKKHCFG